MGTGLRRKAPLRLFSQDPTNYLHCNDSKLILPLTVIDPFEADYKASISILQDQILRAVGTRRFI